MNAEPVEDPVIFPYLNNDPNDPDVRSQAETVLEQKPLYGLNRHFITGRRAGEPKFKPALLKERQDWGSHCEGAGPADIVPSVDLEFFSEMEARFVAYQLQSTLVRGRLIWPSREAVIIARDVQYNDKKTNEIKLSKRYLLFPNRAASLRHLAIFAKTPAANFYDIIQGNTSVQFFADIDLDGEKLLMAQSLGIWNSHHDLMNTFAQEVDALLASKGQPSCFEDFVVSESSKKIDGVWTKWSLHCAVSSLRFTQSQLYKFVDELYAHFDRKGDCRKDGCTEGLKSTCPHLKYKYLTLSFRRLGFQGVLDPAPDAMPLPHQAGPNTLSHATPRVQQEVRQFGEPANARGHPLVHRERSPRGTGTVF